MATISLYDASIGVSTNALLTLLDIMKKAQAHAEAETLASCRLIEDMLPFSQQVLIVSNFAKKYVERLTGRELEVWEDNETTLEQLVARVQKTLDLLKTVSRADVDGAQRAKVSLKIGPFDPVDVTVQEYVLGYGMPNTMFHLTTAYDILRMKGLDLGKKDFLTHYTAGWFPVPK
ncbi:uncharacterized protein B0H64DRAFT_203028 [Chaetomium fimeti]|uniref:DUF1993 domain-containing protein n=1 Tax=Chaetomium fimeti TaxID=1854472 RepID=A0AAE0LPW9_9PEZI|nr:hypothetical protein B0H64DRAFT_203028 [Chaetomium fimeti]